MVNKTKELVGSNFYSNIDYIEATKYFSEIFLGIKYDILSDSFIYDGIIFNYFKSGVGLRKNCYCLVDKDYDKIWIKNLEDYHDYTLHKEQYKKGYSSYLKTLSRLGLNLL